MKRSDSKLDTKSIGAGRKIEVPGDDDGLFFIVRGRRSKAYTSDYNRKMVDLRRLFGSNKRKQAQFMAALADLDNELVAKHCLLGWGNFFEDDGKTEIPFSPGLAVELMTTKEDDIYLYAPFQEAVKEAVDEVDNGYQEVEDDVVGKSSSGGNTTAT